MAKAVDVAQSQWSAYEKGIKTPSLQVLMRISEVFDVSIDHLCGMDIRKQPKLSDVAQSLLNLKYAYDGIDCSLQPIKNQISVAGEKQYEKPEVIGYSLSLVSTSTKEPTIMDGLIEFLEGWYKHASVDDRDEFVAWEADILASLREISITPKSEEEKNKAFKRTQKRMNAIAALKNRNNGNNQ